MASCRSGLCHVSERRRRRLGAGTLCDRKPVWKASTPINIYEFEAYIGKKGRRLNTWGNYREVVNEFDRILTIRVKSRYKALKAIAGELSLCPKRKKQAILACLATRSFVGTSS